MPASIFRRIRLATFAFLAVIFVGVVVLVTLTVYERRRLASAASQLARLYTYERTHIVIAERIITLRASPEIDEAGQRQVREQIEQIVALSTSAEAVRLLRTIPPRLPAIDAAADREPVIELYRAVVIERQHGSRVVADLKAGADSQIQFELGAPLAVVAVGLLLLPLARRRIIAPLDAFGRQLQRLADGQFTPAALDDVDPFLLPLHRQFNLLARRLAQLEAVHRARTESLEAEVRATTRTLLEQQRGLARAERLAATGELAASVAHELRNPLAGIQMTLVNLRGELRDAELAGRVDLVLDEVQRLSRLLNDLLDTARHAPEPAREIQLAELIDDMLALLRCQVAPEIRFEPRVAPDLVCRLPRDRLRQALLNLALNAVAAVGERGTVAIEADAADGRLRLRVSDDGPGFPPEVLARGVRPFFSTRERGTGLGLAVVARFTRDLGGSIDLANRTPHGAEVTLTLPLAVEAG